MSQNKKYSVLVHLRIQAEEAVDGKIIQKIKTIRPDGRKKIYLFPVEHQELKFHEELVTINKIKKICKSIKKCGEFRNISVELPREIANLYLDSDFDPVFKDYYLEEVVEGINKIPENPSLDIPEIIRRIVETLSSNKPQLSFYDITKNFILDNYNGRNDNAELWLENFENECIRFEIAEEKMFEILRLFLDGNAKDWYTSARIKYGLETPWVIFKDSFRKTFSEKGWSSARLVYNFRHKGGSMVEYALKKERMLLSRDPKMPEAIRIDLIVIGLPIFIQEKLDNEIQSTEHLISEIRKFDINVRSSTSIKVENVVSKEKLGNKEKFHPKSEKKPCEICEKLGSPNRFHKQDDCWNKHRIKTVNTTELQRDLNDRISDFTISQKEETDITKRNLMG
ncbi:hypothetical protein WA026_015743 [Henosepilachna vigintioctopunctata]|uniref:Retrotransposon gag domain-containing protein n=1 Tax=Henosepilachna vigintioctopunctata TaxID=420089 RepID=A0AAW1UZ98_9CUCU